MKRCLVVALMVGLSSVLLGAKALEKADHKFANVPLTMGNVKSVCNSVANWQMKHPSRMDKTEWTWGALLAGMMEWSRIDGEKVTPWLHAISEENQWKLCTRHNPYHADDHAVGWSYLELFREIPNPTAEDKKMIADVIARFNWILKNPANCTLEYFESKKRRYSWCDALFMAPPVLFNLTNLTGDSRYLEFANKEWWAATEFLYDKDAFLYSRDSKYFNSKERNGTKVFWGRGNGWVFAALPQVLKYFPKAHPDYSRYVALYQEMAAEIMRLQGADGFWRASMLDPDSYSSPEASGTAFFCYGFLAGVRHGWLDDSYLIPALKAWDALQTAVHDDGKLGWVQPIGEDPKKVTRDMTEIYGVGGFLLAGSELYQLLEAGKIKGEL